MCQVLQRATFTASASGLQGVDDTSSSEGSTVDCPDPEEILRKIPELAEELDEPDDCFPEGTRVTGLLVLMLSRVSILPNTYLSTSVSRTMTRHLQEPAKQAHDSWDICVRAHCGPLLKRFGKL